MASEPDRAPELLRADREQLDRAAGVLGEREPAFVIVVCPRELALAARAHLARRAGAPIPEPLALRGPEEALAALLGEPPELAAAPVRTLAFGGDAKEGLRALNWHREKLLRGAPVLLWLDAVDALTELREAAPDAYSFRNMVVFVRGDRGRLPPIAYKESRGILSARRRLARARTALERGAALASLSEALRDHGHLAEAEDVARRGLEALPEEKRADEGAKVVRAMLWASLGLAAGERGAAGRQREAAQRGQGELGPARSEPEQEALVWLFAAVPGPLGRFDRAASEQALAIARGLTASRPSTQAEAARAASCVAADLGDIPRARELLRGVEPAALAPVDATLVLAERGAVERRAGRLVEAEALLLTAMSARRREHAAGARVAYVYAMTWLERGEIGAAERVVQESLPESEPTHRGCRRRALAVLALARGDLDAVHEQLRLQVRESIQLGLDQRCLDACALHARAAARAHDVGRADGAALEKVVAELEVAEDVARSLADGDPPPWYAVRFLGYRADLLARAGRRDEAEDLARRALDRAREASPDLVPARGRALADLRIRAGRPREALVVLAVTEPEAVARGARRELCRLRAARVSALVLRGEAPAAIDGALAALRQALDATAAPRIAAEVLLDLAIRLPPEARLPDPLALAGETHSLFVEMPMPAQEARSLELAGDVLAARGKPADAKRRYLTAQAILERRGLGLRLPLLAEKIARAG